MADYRCALRTNYFHVNNDEAFRSMMSRVYGVDKIELFEKKDNNGKSVFSFGTYGEISGLIDGDTYDDFIDQLQAFITDDAIIIFEVGHEKLNYLVGNATIITSTNYKHIDISELAVTQARALLNNPLWQTECDY